MDVAELLGVVGHPVHVVERTATGTKSALSTKLEELAPWLSVIAASCGDRPCPRTRIEGSAEHGEITFLGSIEGRQIEPYALLLRALATGDAGFDTPATPGLLAELRENVGVGVAVSASCPHCPAVASAALRLALASPRVSVVVARADLGFAGSARSVPIVRVNGRIVASGPISEYALAERVMDPVR